MRYAAVALCLTLLGWSAAPAMAAPCTTATPACTEFVTPGSAPVRVLVSRSFPLDVKNADVIRAVVMVHGAGRDADNYFLHTLAATFLARALDNTVVISPRFASNNGGCSDTLADREANWECGGSRYRATRDTGILSTRTGDSEKRISSRVSCPPVQQTL